MLERTVSLCLNPLLPTSFSFPTAVCRSRATADSSFLISPGEYWHLFLKTVELFLLQLYSVFWQQFAAVQCHPGVPVSHQERQNKNETPSPLTWKKKNLNNMLPCTVPPRGRNQKAHSESCSTNLLCPHPKAIRQKDNFHVSEKAPSQFCWRVCFVSLSARGCYHVLQIN